MKKFIYPLQNVLNIKSKIETQEKMLFRIAVNTLNAETDKLNTLYARKDGYEEKIKENISSRLNLLELKSLRDAVKTMDELIAQQKAEVRKAERQVEIARKRLEEAIKEKKIHEKMKENAFEEYKKEYEREEQREIDELVSYRYTLNEGRTS